MQNIAKAITDGVTFGSLRAGLLQVQLSGRFAAHFTELPPWTARNKSLHLKLRRKAVITHYVYYIPGAMPHHSTIARGFTCYLTLTAWRHLCRLPH